MKNFKDILDVVSEEYYTGPTVYAGGDNTNVGDISGSDMGGYADGSKNPGATPSRFAQLEAGINAELAGHQTDPVTAITKARTKLNSTGLSFDINASEINTAALTGGEYTTNLTFGGHPLGNAVDSNPADDFARSEIDSGVVPVETTMPEAMITFIIIQKGTGFSLTAKITE